MSEAWTRLRHRRHADRVVRVHVVETKVMGRGAVLWTAACMTPAAVVQATTQDSSRLLANFGGMRLSIVWATILLCGIAVVWASRFIGPPLVRVPFEAAGTMLVASAFLAYAGALLLETGWVGALFVVTLCWTSGTNLLARAVMLCKQVTHSLSRGVRKVAKEPT